MAMLVQAAWHGKQITCAHDICTPCSLLDEQPAPRACWSCLCMCAPGEDQWCKMGGASCNGESAADMGIPLTSTGRSKVTFSAC